MTLLEQGSYNNIITTYIYPLLLHNVSKFFLTYAGSLLIKLAEFNASIPIPLLSCVPQVHSPTLVPWKWPFLNQLTRSFQHWCFVFLITILMHRTYHPLHCLYIYRAVHTTYSVPHGFLTVCQTVHTGLWSNFIHSLKVCPSSAQCIHVSPPVFLQYLDMWL